MTTTKKLGLFDSVLLVSGSMIGSGIFLVTGDMTPTARKWTAGFAGLDPYRCNYPHGSPQFW
jgi:amino acid transporter